MKPFLLVLFIFCSFTAWPQQDTTMPATPVKHPAYQRYSLIATLSAGFVDYYRQNYTLPQGYEKGNTTGFTPLYGKLEYAVSRHISIAATGVYDAFVYNYNQLYTGNTGTFTRYRADNFRLFSGGLTAFYHFGSWIPVRALDPFIGVGISLNNVRYSAYPQGDTMGVNLTHPVTPSIRVGARYYLSSQCSFFGDIGYDKQSIFSLGISCRFFQRHKKIKQLDTNSARIPDNHNLPVAAVPGNNQANSNDSIQKEVVAPKEVLIPVPATVIRFIPATATIADSSYAVLDSMISVLKGNSKTDISIEGYIITGGQAAPKKTANARAIAIKKYLADKGIAATRLIFNKPGVVPKAKKHRGIIQLMYDLTY